MNLKQNAQSKLYVSWKNSNYIDFNFSKFSSKEYASFLQFSSSSKGDFSQRITWPRIFFKEIDQRWRRRWIFDQIFFKNKDLRSFVATLCSVEAQTIVQHHTTPQQSVLSQVMLGLLWLTTQFQYIMLFSLWWF